MDFNMTQKVGKSQSEGFNTSTDKEDSQTKARRISQSVQVNAEWVIEKDFKKYLSVQPGGPKHYVFKVNGLQVPWL